MEDYSLRFERSKFKVALSRMVVQSKRNLQGSDSDTDSQDSKGSTPKNIRKEIYLSSPSESPKPAMVMRLYDRTIDLAKFDETTPLYPVCRDWIRNKPISEKQVREEEEESSHHQRYSPDDIDFLPPPVPLCPEEFGRLMDIKMPLLVPEEQKPFVVDSEEHAPEDLFKCHMLHWKAVRQRSHEASHINEQRYFDSLRIIHNSHVGSL